MTNPTRMIAVVIKSKNINRLIRILHALIMNLPVAPMIVFHSLGFAIPPLIAKMGQMKMLHFAGLKSKFILFPLYLSLQMCFQPGTSKTQILYATVFFSPCITTENTWHMNKQPKFHRLKNFSTYGAYFFNSYYCQMLI